MIADVPSQLGPSDWECRTKVYQYFAETTEAPTVDELVRQTGWTEPEVVGSLERLAANHQIALAPGTTNVWMAHPFSAVPTEYPVDTSRGRYWANCAWDMLAIPAMLGLDSRTAARCAESGVAVELVVKDDQLEEDDGVVHFVVRPSDFWDNVGFT